MVSHATVRSRLAASRFAHCPGNFFFTLLTTGRAYLSLDILRYPLFIGLVFWAFCRICYGAAPDIILTSAIFFQLVWLDLFYVGTYVPPQPLLPYLVFLALALCFGLETPQECLFLLILCLPLSVAAARLGAWQRGSQGDKNYLKLLESVNAGGNVPAVLQSVLYRELIRRAAAYAALCAGATLLLFALVWLLGVQLESWPVASGLGLPLDGLFEDRIVTAVHGLAGGWGLFWVFAAVGGLLSLRIRPALFCFLTGAAAVGLWLLVL